MSHLSVQILESGFGSTDALNAYGQTTPRLFSETKVDGRRTSLSLSSSKSISYQN